MPRSVDAPAVYGEGVSWGIASAAIIDRLSIDRPVENASDAVERGKSRRAAVDRACVSGCEAVSWGIRGEG